MRVLPMSAYRADRAAGVYTVRIDTFLAHQPNVQLR
jgi:hypothetical protein